VVQLLHHVRHGRFDLPPDQHLLDERHRSSGPGRRAYSTGRQIGPTAEVTRDMGCPGCDNGRGTARTPGHAAGSGSRVAFHAKPIVAATARPGSIMTCARVCSPRLQGRRVVNGSVSGSGEMNATNRQTIHPSDVVSEPRATATLTMFQNLSPGARSPDEDWKIHQTSTRYGRSPGLIQTLSVCSYQGSDRLDLHQHSIFN